jgi:hypothetical protein
MVDNIIMVQEAMHYSRSRKDKGMIIKMDMANAFFNKERLSFVVLRKIGFSNKFID